ncbi:MAG TPA: nuclear transport factor 2 family protein [Phnomibacter sp.]|nr:nuclear transport factor 2 family protein [Phnomibacter sp.]
MKYSLLAVFLLTAFQVSFAQNSPAEKYVKAFSERKNKWLIEKNYDSLKAMLDNRCLYIHSNGWSQTAADVIKDLQTGKMVYNKVSITESQARQFESMVIVTGKGNFEGSVDQKPFNIRLAYTEVYIKRKDNWKLVSRQSAKLEQ